VGASGKDAALEIISSTADEERRDDRQKSPGNDLCIEPVLRVHFLIIDDHVTIPGATWSHNGVPNGSAGVRSDELTESIDGAKASTRFPRTLKDQRRNGEIDARFYMTAEKSRGWSGINKEWATGGIVKARGQRGGINGSRRASL